MENMAMATEKPQVSPFHVGNGTGIHQNSHIIQREDADHKQQKLLREKMKLDARMPEELLA